MLWTEGCGALLGELLQNADDAEASRVAFMLDERTHGGSTVLGESMASLQGPALLCYDVSDRKTFRRLKSWLSAVRTNATNDQICITLVG